MKKSIQVTRNGIADIFALPCVRSINKAYTNNRLMVHLFDSLMVALETDWLCCYGSNDWRVLTDEQYKKLQSVGCGTAAEEPQNK